jgi:hypothetical protein
MIGFRASYASGTYSGYGAAIKARASGGQGASGSGGQLEFWTTDDGTTTLDQRMTINDSGNVGIGTTAPRTALTVQGNGTANGYSGVLRIFNTDAAQQWGGITLPNTLAGTSASNNYYLLGRGNTIADRVLSIHMPTAADYGSGNNPIFGVFSTGSNKLFSVESATGNAYFKGNVGIGTTNPGAYKLNVAGSIYATGLDMGGDIAMGDYSITGINKLTVNTIDPLYSIKGINYSTFVSAIVGGVKEEYIGRGILRNRTASGEYELVLDFDQIKEGSDLWVWRQVVDFSPENVESIITPYGNYAQVYYLIKDNSLIFRSDRAVDISYRLSGKRHDWQQWPTKAINQTEKAGFIIK